MGDEGSEEVGPFLDRPARVPCRAAEGGKVVLGAVGERIRLEVGPKVFDGIQLGAVGREEGRAEARTAA